MPGENELGDLIVEMRLDDTKYRADVKRAIVDTQAQVKSMPQNRDLFGRFMGAGDKLNPYKAMVRDAEFAAKANDKVKDSFGRVASTKQSIQALHGSLFLVTGETGFFAVEALRAASHVGKLATSSGGLTASLGAAATSAKAFLVAIGPVGWTLIAAAGAYKILSEVINADLAKAEKRSEKLMGQLPVLNAFEKAAKENAMARGDLSPGEARIHELMGIEGMKMAGAKRILAKEEDTARLKEVEAKALEDQKAWQDASLQWTRDYQSSIQKSIDDKMAIIEEGKRRELQAEIKGEEDIQDRLSQMRQHDEQELQKSIDRTTSMREAIFSFKVRQGLAMPSEDMPEGAGKMMAVLEEQRAAIRKAAEGQGGASGFGIGSVDSNAFRFGPGAFGSVIGQQSEQAQSNGYLKSIDEETKKLAANIAKIAADWVTGGMSIPMPGL